MSTRHMSRLESRLQPGDGVVRKRRRRRAVDQLAADLSPRGVELLAREAMREDGDRRVRDVAQEALERVTDQEQIDVLCSLWAMFRYAAIGQLIVRKGWVASGPAHVRALSALKGGRPNALANDDASVVRALVAALGDGDPTIARGAAQALRALRNPQAIQAMASASFTTEAPTRRALRDALANLDQPAVDAVCELWARTRERSLDALLAQSGWVASGPPEVRVLTALHAGRPEALAGDGPAVVPLLLAASQGNRGDATVLAARRALELLTEPAAQEALCRDVIDNEDPVAAEAARNGGFAPADAADRALFLFLTRQWDRYADLDFDQSYLHAAYAAADATLRERLAACARADGRREWVTVVAGARRGRRLAEMTDREWETALAVLARSKRWDEVWRLAQDAPVRWAARFLTRLSEAEWSPADPEDRAAVDRLVVWARGCQGEPPTNLLARHAEPVQRFSRAVRCLATTPDGRTLAIGMPGGGIQIWRLPQRVLRATLDGSVGGEDHVCFTLDNASLVSAGFDGVIRLWSLRDLSKPARVLGRHTGAAHAVAMVDKQRLVSGGLDKLIRRWDLEDPTRRAVWRGHSRGVDHLVVVDQAGLLASGGRDGMRLWSLGNGVARAVPAGLEAPLAGLSRVSQLQLAVLMTDGNVRIWSIPDGTVRGLPSLRASCIAGVPDKAMALIGNRDGNLMVVRGREPTTVLTIGTAHERPITAVTASANGDVIVTAGADGLVLHWQPEVYRWDRFPLAEAGSADLARLEAVLLGPTTSQERPWLELAAGLLRWRRRHDIELASASSIEVGEFDIELGQVDVVG